MAFRFKQFSVEDQQSTMRVGSDAVLLGAWARVAEDSHMLEIGTGCGVISLMLAQRSTARIDAIEIDEPSFLQAQENFAASPWNQRLHPILISLQEFTRNTIEKYDHILTNPPFFRNSLKSPDPVKNSTKHESLLTFEEILHSAIRLLDRYGKLSLILPPKEGELFTEMAAGMELFLTRETEISPKSGKPVNRKLLEFSFILPSHFISDQLTIRLDDNAYTDEYREFTAPYYFSLK